MKQGKSIQDLAAELMRRSASKEDFVVDSNVLHVSQDNVAGAKPTLNIDAVGSFGITPFAHGQLAEKTGIPKAYYERLLAEGQNGTSLWASNVNHWLGTSTDRRMVRTLDNNMRALLSDRYHRIDNEHVAQVALPVLMEGSGIQIVSCEVTERKLYIKAVVTNLLREVKKGDAVRSGVEIGNSEIGDGSIYVYPWIERLVCLNGMCVTEYKWRRAHVGSRLELPDGILLADDTMQAEDNAILLKMRDMIRAATSEIMLEKIVTKLQGAAATPAVKSPQAAVQLLSKTVGLLQSEQEGVLERLIRGSDYTLYGMANAITNLANDTESYDRASELEKIGGNVITLPTSEWKRVSEAELRQAA